MTRVRSCIVAYAALAFALPLAAQATRAESSVVPDGKWMVRLRAVAVRPADRSDAIPSAGAAADAIAVSSKAIAALDVTWFATPHLAAELVLTTPQSHDVQLGGADIGRLRQLPVTLLAQYHFLPAARVRPYIGAGLNVTFFSGVTLVAPGLGPLALDDASAGIAGQVGADVRLTPRWYLNVDAKWTQVGSELSLAATRTRIGAIGIDPYLLGVGLGYRF